MMSDISKSCGATKIPTKKKKHKRGSYIIKRTPADP